jgi:nitrite reductase/ring-hydroxylating ferredoxin subunit
VLLEAAVHSSPGDTVVVALADELKEGQMKLLIFPDRRVVLGRTSEGYVAFDDRCTHRGGPLSDGVLACDTVACPWHGSQFDVNKGKVKAGPAEAAIATYPVKEVEGEVRLTLPKA